MFNDYLTWWVAQMRQWLPRRLTDPNRGATHALLIDPIPQGVEIMLRHPRADRTLGRFSLDAIGLRALQAAMPGRGRPDAVVLRLPPTLLLEREVVLPLAAEREPERVLAYEMDRISPFTTTEVFWTYAVERRDRANGRLHLRLSLVTKAAIEALLTALSQVGLRPTVLEVRNIDDVPRRIALRRPDSRYERLVRRAVIAGGALCAVLVVAAVAMPFAVQSITSRKIEARMVALRPRVAEAEALRHRIATTAAGVDVVEAERVRVGDAIDVLAALTGLLPDDTYLTDFALRQGKLTINGQSAAAVRLIARLSGDPVVHNPEFVAPVTRFDNRADLFAIRAEVAR